MKHVMWNNGFETRYLVLDAKGNVVGNYAYQTLAILHAETGVAA